MISADKLSSVLKRVSVAGVDDCWPWTGSHSGRDGKFGYPTVMVKQRLYKVHRLVCELASGEPRKGQYALHSCDNSMCCNPRHLRWGSHAENMKDKATRGRARGALSTMLAVSVRKMAMMGMPQWRIAATFGVNQSTVSRVVNRKRYAYAEV